MKRKLLRYVTLANIALLLTKLLFPEPDRWMLMEPEAIWFTFGLQKFVIYCGFLLTAVMLWLLISIVLEDRGIIKTAGGDAEESGTDAGRLSEKVPS